MIDVASTQAGLSSSVLSPALDWIVGEWHRLSPRDVAVVVAMLIVIRVSSRLGLWAYAIVSMPGTLAHELAHFLVALVMAARPSFPTLIPQRTEHGWRLGSVAFRAGMIRSVPIALAPFVLAPLSLWWAATLLAGAAWPWYPLHAWIAAALFSASLPSRADFRIAFPALAIGVVAVVVIWMFSAANGG